MDIVSQETQVQPDRFTGINWVQGAVYASWDAGFVKHLIGIQKSAVSAEELEAVKELVREYEAIQTAMGRWSMRACEAKIHDTEMAWRASLLDPKTSGTVDKPKPDEIRKQFSDNGVHLATVAAAVGWKSKPACDLMLKRFLLETGKLLSQVIEKDKKECAAWGVPFAPSQWARKIHSQRLAAQNFLTEYPAHAYPNPKNLLCGLVD